MTCNPCVVERLGDGRAQDLHHRDRLGPLPARHGSAEHGEVLGVSAHARGQVVDAEQTLEQVGFLDVVLQLVEQVDLAVHDRLQPVREIDEHAPVGNGRRRRGSGRCRVRRSRGWRRVGIGTRMYSTVPPVAVRATRAAHTTPATMTRSTRPASTETATRVVPRNSRGWEARTSNATARTPDNAAKADGTAARAVSCRPDKGRPRTDAEPAARCLEGGLPPASAAAAAMGS